MGKRFHKLALQGGRWHSCLDLGKTTVIQPPAIRRHTGREAPEPIQQFRRVESVIPKDGIRFLAARNQHGVRRTDDAFFGHDSTASLPHPHGVIGEIARADPEVFLSSSLVDDATLKRSSRDNLSSDCHSQDWKVTKTVLSPFIEQLAQWSRAKGSVPSKNVRSHCPHDLRLEVLRNGCLQGARGFYRFIRGTQELKDLPLLIERWKVELLCFKRRPIDCGRE